MKKKKKFKSWIGKSIPRKVDNSNKLSRKIRTNAINPNETIILDEKRKNQFDVSFGNIRILRLIPDMMNDNEYRNKLRMLALEFMQEYGIR